MAKQDCKSEPIISKIQRTAVVGYRPNRGKPNPAAQICLQGHWLKEAGFKTGLPLDIRVMHGCLVITTRPPEPEIPLSQQMLKHTAALSEKAQQELCVLVNALLIREDLGVFEGKG